MPGLFLLLVCCSFLFFFFCFREIQVITLLRAEGNEDFHGTREEDERIRKPSR